MLDHLRWWLSEYVDYYRAGRWPLLRLIAEIILRLLPGDIWLKMELMRLRKLSL